MVGKTFKGMTDELLAWQTEQFSAHALATKGHVVWLPPEFVVEIELDGVQLSTRYPAAWRCGSPGCTATARTRPPPTPTPSTPSAPPPLTRESLDLAGRVR